MIKKESICLGEFSDASPPSFRGYGNPYSGQLETEILATRKRISATLKPTEMNRDSLVCLFISTTFVVGFHGGR